MSQTTQKPNMGLCFCPPSAFLQTLKWITGCEGGANLENLKSKLFKVLSCHLQQHWVGPCKENECQLRRGVNKINHNEEVKGSEILVVINHLVGIFPLNFFHKHFQTPSSSPSPTTIPRPLPLLEGNTFTCLFVFVYLYLCICICVFVFSY